MKKASRKERRVRRVRISRPFLSCILGSMRCERGLVSGGRGEEDARRGCSPSLGELVGASRGGRRLLGSRGRVSGPVYPVTN